MTSIIKLRDHINDTRLNSDITCTVNHDTLQVMNENGDMILTVVVNYDSASDYIPDCTWYIFDGEYEYLVYGSGRKDGTCKTICQIIEEWFEV